MRKPFLSAPQVAGLLVGLLGSILAARWVFQLDAIGRLIPGAQLTGIVSPLLFVATGVCFFNASRSPSPAVGLRRLSAIGMAALIGLPLAYLFEGVTGVGLGIDFVRGSVVPTAAIPHPGRLSANASLAFLFTGIAFWLLERRPTRIGKFSFLALDLAIALIGLGGLAGHLVGLETLYQVASFNRILPATALGLSVVGVGLWMLHEASQAFDAKALNESERRIRRRSIAVITLVALAGGVAGFAVMRDNFEESVLQDMRLVATTSATSLAHTVEVSLWLPTTVANRPAGRQALDKLSRAPADAPAKDFLQKVAESFLTSELTGVEIYAVNGVRVAQAGSMTFAQAKIIQRLGNAGQSTFLAWKDGYILVAETDVRVDGRSVGRVLTEQRMPLFDRLLAEVRASRPTSDVTICGREQDKAICAPNRLSPAGFDIPLFDAVGNPAVPAARALLGERGVQTLKDPRGINVVSAFAPIEGFGLGLAVKTDVYTLYAPMRSRLNVLVLCLVGIVALAIYAQHSQVRPMLRRLVASEQMVKAILDDQSELVSLVKPDGELVYVNPAYARHFALFPAQMVGKNLYDYVQPADRETVRQAVYAVLSTGETTTGESPIKTSDGTERWISWTDSLQRDPAGMPLLHSVGRDVTERKQAEMALRASQALLARMGRVAGVGGWELDLPTGTLTWTEETRRIHDVGPDFKPTLDAATAFFAPESRSIIDAAFQAGSRLGQSWTVELPLVTATGRRIWVRMQGEAELQDDKPVRLVGAIQDITERIAAERGLRTLTAVFEATTDYVVQLDKTGRLTYMNPAGRRRTGLAPDAPIEQLTLEDFNPPHTLDRFISEVGPTAVATGVWVGESMVWDAERVEFPVSHIVICHRDAQGRVEYFSGLMRDISDAKAAERAVRDSAHRLRMVTDNLPVLISYLDRELRFRFTNRTYQQWFGAEAAPQLGMSVQAFYGPQIWLEIGPQLKAALEGQEVVYDRELEGLSGTRHVQVTLVPDRDEQGQVVGLYSLISDVTHYREAQRALQESEARLRTVADALPMRVAYIDADERYRFNNLGYERWFGQSRHELQGQTVRSLLGDAAYASVEPHIRSALRGEAVTFQSEIPSGDGHAWYEAQYIPQLSVDGHVVLGFHAVISDITRQKVEEKRLTELAHVDPLTGLVNRAGFESRIAAAMERCRISGALMALMYLDIDRFKQVNDTFGHNAGDALLRAFAGRLSRTLRSSDTVARMGGDEFTVIMEGLRGPEPASTVAAKIVQAMRPPFVIGLQTMDVTTSIGLAFYEGGAATADELVMQADAMLYRAKDEGRNNVQVAVRTIDGGSAHP